MNRAIGCLAGVLVLALWPGAAVAQSGAWETTMAAGMSAHQGGHYAEAEEKFSAALKEAEAFGPEDPRLAAIPNTRPPLPAPGAQPAGAEPLSRQALAIREKALGAEHADVAASLENLGSIYAAQGQYARAEPLLRRALGIREKTLGPEQPEVAQSLNALVELARARGQAGAAKPLASRALRRAD